ncbi:MAG TPA: GNAT family N-acetyltransferase [Candidatus Limnocylindrales bacterium]
MPATPERWDDLATLMGGDGELGCYCQYWRLSSGDFSRTRHREGLRASLDADLAPGLLAYLDGEIAGWCSVGPRRDYQRLVRSRTIPVVDDQPVWSIVCFKVRVGYRRRGVARALLAGAIDYARDRGAPALEAYPIDAGGQRLDVGFAYVGTASMFDKAGFQRIVESDARSASRPRILMRLPL